MDIRKTKKPIRLKGIKGKTIEIEEEGDLLGYGPVYYHAQITANVLSLFNMARRFQSIVYNNKICDAFLVTRDDGTIVFEDILPHLFYFSCHYWYDSIHFFLQSVLRDLGRFNTCFIICHFSCLTIHTYVM